MIWILFCLLVSSVCSAKEAPITEEITQALAQPYHYFGAGGQSQIFFSEDGRYVLKCLKQKPVHLPTWVRYLPLPFLVQQIRNRQVRKIEAKRERAIASFQLCKERFAKETGLMYVHLNEEDGTVFLLQRRAQRTFEAIDQWVKEERLDLAKKGIESMLFFQVELFKKGMRNRDPNLRSNCGFLEEAPILFDIGRVVYSEEVKQPQVYTQELQKMTPRLRSWLLENHPELVETLDQTVAKICSGLE